MAQTLCPRCGYSPIPAGAERCPKCKQPFFEDDRKYENTSVTATRAGGLTGSVTAFPGAILLALTVGALLWTIRGMGILGSLGDPQWVYGIAALQVVAGIFLLTTSGPAKQAPALAGLLACAAAALCSAPWPVTVLCLAHGAGLVLGTIAEPARARLTAGGAFSTIAGLAALAALPVTVHALERPPVVLHDPLLGFTLSLPPGWEEASRADLGLELQVPLHAEGSGALAFKHEAHHLLGVLSVSTAAAGLDGCQKTLGAMKLTNLVASTEAAPATFGKLAQLLEARSLNGVGWATCGSAGETQLTLAVISLEANEAAALTALEAVAAGFSR
jgi:hypothetical protein